MVNDSGHGAVKTTTEARQGSRATANLHVLVVTLALLAVIGVGLYFYFISRTPIPVVPGTGATPLEQQK